MHFETPQLLWLIILPVSFFLLSVFRSYSIYAAKVIRLETLVALILIFAWANPVKEDLKKAGTATIVVDVSNSVDALQAAPLFSQAREMLKDFPAVSVIPFSEKVVSGSPFPLKDFPTYQSVRASASQLSKERSNLEAALSLATEHSSNIILISDGHQNLGNVLAYQNTYPGPIFPLLPDQAPVLKEQFLGLSALDLPLVASAQKSVEIKVAVKNSLMTPQNGELQIFHDEKKIYSEKVSIAAGQEALFKANSDPAKEGIKEVKAVFEPADKSFPKSIKKAFLSTEKREKVLLLNGAPEDGRLLRQAFEGQAYDLVNLESPQQAAPALKDFSAVLLNNIAFNQLPPGFSSQLSEYTRAGGAFIMLGGNRSFGLGGYVGTTIAELLPLEPLPPEAQQKRLTVAVELIIDKSRSMADNDKLEFSKEAAREVVRNLKDEDFIGVIGFDASPFEVVKLGKVGQIRAQASERIGRLFPAQKTNLFPAMDEGRRRLESVEAGRKHMIVLTDGKIPDADQSYLELVKQMRLNGVTLSTVLVGADYDFGFLRDMAERGGGAFYQTSDPSSLPKIFLQDVKVRSGEKTMQEQKEFPVSVGPSGLKSTKIDDYPVLLGFVETKAKSDASLELTIRSQDRNFPLLASWNLGQGKVVAFSSDANGRWSRPWGVWSRFVPFWTDILDSVRSKNDESPIKFNLSQQIQGDDVKLDLTLYEDPKGAALNASIIGPDGKLQMLKFNELAKGSYQAQLAAGSVSGRYEFRATVGKRTLTAVAFDVAEASFKEQRGQGFNATLLEQLANISAGKVNPVAQDLSKTAVKSSFTSFRWLLLIAALLTYIFGILWRELRLNFKSFTRKF